MQVPEAAVAASDDQPRLFVSRPGERDVFVVLDAKGVIKEVAPRTRRVLASDRKGTFGQSAVGDVHPADLDTAMGVFAAAMAEPGVPQHMRVRYEHWVEGLTGEVGDVTRDLDPEGRVFVHGETWSAVSSAGPILRGAKVRVLRVDHLKLTVEPAGDPTSV